MCDELAQKGRQTGPASATKLGMLRKRQGLVTQLLAELLRPDLVVLGDVINDVV